MVEQCLDCHGTGNNPGGDLRMNTFNETFDRRQQRLDRVARQAGHQPAASQAQGNGHRTDAAKGKPPLSADVIAKFEKWIAEGAHFDGLNPKDSIEMVADSL